MVLALKNHQSRPCPSSSIPWPPPSNSILIRLPQGILGQVQTNLWDNEGVRLPESCWDLVLNRAIQREAIFERAQAQNLGSCLHLPRDSSDILGTVLPSLVPLLRRRG